MTFVGLVESACSWEARISIVKVYMEDPLYRRIRKHAQQRFNFTINTDRAARVREYAKFLSLEAQLLKRYHKQGDSGRRVARARAICINVLITHLYNFAVRLYEKEFGKLPCPMALVATGGYGRQEMAPHSDIDIMFLFPKRVRTQTIRKIEEVIVTELTYVLWDLKLKVGERCSRTISQCIDAANEDDRSLNSQLDAFFLAGSKSLFSDYWKEFVGSFSVKDLIEYAEQQTNRVKARHKDFGGTVYLQAPDVKEGCGGLRDYQQARWLVRLATGESTMKKLSAFSLLTISQQRSLRNSYNYLLRVRNEIHFLNDRPTDVLTIEQQPEVALRLGYEEPDVFKRVEVFMADYYHHAHNIYWLTDVLLYRLKQMVRAKRRTVALSEVISSRHTSSGIAFDGFALSNGYLTYTNKKIFQKDPLRLIRIFRYRQQYLAKFTFDLTMLIRQETEQLVSRKFLDSSGWQKAFLPILFEKGNVFEPLYAMNEHRLLGRLIPAFGKLCGLVQHEFYHRYTADVHTLRTFDELDRLFRSPQDMDLKYARVLKDLPSPEDLYLILLLHDLGKGTGIKGHAKRSMELSKKILAQLQISPERTARILFIVEQHGEMARYSQKYDIDDPTTIQSFSSFVGDTLSLRYLFIITYCDARATSAELWNGFKDSLHSRFYQNCEKYLGAPDQLLASNLSKKLMLHHKLLETYLPNLEEDEVTAHFTMLPDRYFALFSQEEVQKHLYLVHDFLFQVQTCSHESVLGPIVDWEDDQDRGYTKVTIISWDRAGLFSKIAGSFSLANISILSANAISREDHISIDTFFVTSAKGGLVQSAKMKEEFESTLRSTLLENKNLLPLIEASIQKESKRVSYTVDDPLRAPIHRKVEIYNELSLHRTIVEVLTNDNLGLLYRVTNAIYQYGFDITFARISTERRVAIDTFYIENIIPNTPMDPQKLDALQKTLHSIVNDLENCAAG